MKSLDSLLQTLQITSVLQNRVVVAEPWGVTFPARRNVARFHFVEIGEANLLLQGHSPIRLSQGDLVIVFTEDSHSMVDRHLSPPTDVKTLVDRAQVLCASGITLHFGGSGPESSVITGVFHFDEGHAHPILRALPPYIVTRRKRPSARLDRCDAQTSLR